MLKLEHPICKNAKIMKITFSKEKRIHKEEKEESNKKEIFIINKCQKKIIAT